MVMKHVMTMVMEMMMKVMVVLMSTVHIHGINIQIIIVIVIHPLHLGASNTLRAAHIRGWQFVYQQYRDANTEK